MTHPALGTLRYFGRCPVDECTHHQVLDEKSHPGLRRLPGIVGTRFPADLVLLDHTGRDWPLHGADRAREWAAVMAGAGLVCPNHQRVLVFEPGSRRPRPHQTGSAAAAECGLECATSTDPTCDCACGGRHHGSSLVTRMASRER